MTAVSPETIPSHIANLQTGIVSSHRGNCQILRFILPLLRSLDEIWILQKPSLRPSVLAVFAPTLVLDSVAVRVPKWNTADFPGLWLWLRR